MTHSVRTFGLALVIATALPLGAQEPSSRPDTVLVAPGAIVRVSATTLANPALVGRLDTLQADSLWIRYDRTLPPVGLAREAVTRLDVSRGHPGRRARTLRGAALGGVAGALFGVAVTDRAGCADCTPEYVRSRRTRTALFFGAVGGLGGALVASMFGREQWVPGRLPAREP